MTKPCNQQVYIHMLVCTLQCIHFPLSTCAFDYRFLFFSNLNNPKKRQEEEMRNDYDNYFNLYLQKYTLLHIMHKIIAQNCTTQSYVSPVTNTSKHVIMVITYAN